MTVDHRDLLAESLTRERRNPMMYAMAMVTRFLLIDPTFLLIIITIITSSASGAIPVRREP